MDRFEECSCSRNIWKNRDLHSSMDRFEGSYVVGNANDMLNLHSSMDRFEVQVCKKSKC